MAAVEEDVQKVKALVDKGADVNFQDHDGVTVLMEASKEGKAGGGELPAGQRERRSIPAASEAAQP